MSKNKRLKKLFPKRSNSVINESTDFENETAEERYRKWDVESIGMSIQTFKELDSGIKDAIEGKHYEMKSIKPEYQRLFF